jgi:Ni/Fe-hydrogenase b-type cytochrome subunit
MTGMAASDAIAIGQRKKMTIHPLVIRLTHWINVVALYVMVTSGLRIYNASPLFSFEIPDWMTFGGWLAGARNWHFFAMWWFVFNGVVWVGYNLLSRHGRRTTLFKRKDAKGILPMIQYYLRIRKDHPESGKYNPLQKLAYTVLPLIVLVEILSGLAIYWPVQAQGLSALFCGYDIARYWHFGGMLALVLFFLNHIFMVMISGWGNFVSMITGRK